MLDAPSFVGYLALIDGIVSVSVVPKTNLTGGLMFNFFFDYIAPVLVVVLLYQVFKLPKYDEIQEDDPSPVSRSGEPLDVQRHNGKPPRHTACR